MKVFIRQRLREAISASEAYRDESAIQTVIDGRRNVGFITLIGTTLGRDKFWELVERHNLKIIKVPSNDYEAYIYYNEGGESQAKELLDIAEKYGGYLAHNATAEDTRRIGQLLGYEESDIDKFIADKYGDKNTRNIGESNEGLKTACNTMSVPTWSDGCKLLLSALGHPKDNPDVWHKIKGPLKNWKDADTSINNQVNDMGMSGDSMVDESNTWWAAIQSTICK